MKESIKLDNGKYEVILNMSDDDSPHSPPFEFKALRYGDEWRNLTGDNLIYLLFEKVLEQKNEIEKLKEHIENISFPQ